MVLGLGYKHHGETVQLALLSNNFTLRIPINALECIAIIIELNHLIRRVEEQPPNNMVREEDDHGRLTFSRPAVADPPVRRTMVNLVIRGSKPGIPKEVLLAAAQEMKAVFQQFYDARWEGLIQIGNANIFIPSGGLLGQIMWHVY